MTHHRAEVDAALALKDRATETYLRNIINSQQEEVDQLRSNVASLHRLVNPPKAKAKGKGKAKAKAKAIS